MNEDQAKRLREQFPPSAIGRLPKAGLQLEYVGHAATTDRLLQVDPEWTWEPMARDERGLPMLDEHGNLWILLTVCGVTRPGVGDGPTAKERIGDALRNAAMRFGVALDLWAKEDLTGSDNGAQALQKSQRARIERKAEEFETAADSAVEDKTLPTDRQKKKLGVLVGELRDKHSAITTDQLWAAVAKMRKFPAEDMIELLGGRDAEGVLHFGPLLADLRRDEASALIDRLEKLEVPSAA